MDLSLAMTVYGFSASNYVAIVGDVFGKEPLAKQRVDSGIGTINGCNTQLDDAQQFPPLSHVVPFAHGASEDWLELHAGPKHQLSPLVL